MSPTTTGCRHALVALFLFFSSFGTILSGQSQTAEPSIPDTRGIGPERRMFELPSRQAWNTVRKGLEQLGFSFDRTDRGNQVVLTKWREIGAKGLEWLTAQHLSETQLTTRIRFLVFVSPFVEPARISVGSVVETEVDASRLRTAYNLSSANQALMARIATLLGQDGRAIPSSYQDRRRLVRSLLKTEDDVCLADELPKGIGRVTPPQKISVSEVPFLYPTPAGWTKTEGTVRVEFVIREDGSVTGLKILNPELGGQLEHAAIGVVSLLSYVPAKLDACGVEAIMTYNIHYSLQ